MSIIDFRNTLSQSAQQDVKTMLAPGAGYLAFTKAGDASVVIHLRVDQIHAYAPVGNEMEVFFGTHVWRVREHFQALQAILQGRWSTIAGTIDGTDARPTSTQMNELYNQLSKYLPAYPMPPSTASDRIKW